MKRNGFTLAELLVTLSIIGVVTALVLPQFTARVHYKAHAAKLATIVSDYENAIGMMMLKESRDNVFDTSAGSLLSSSSTTAAADFSTALGRYLRINSVDTSLSGLGYHIDVSYNFNPLIPMAIAAPKGGSKINDFGEVKGDDKGSDATGIGDSPKSGEQGKGDSTTGSTSSTGTSFGGNTGGNASGNKINNNGTNFGSASHNSTSGTGSNSGSSADIKTINNTIISSFPFKFAVNMQNGANIFFRTPETVGNTTITRVFIDTNGSDSPNKYGRDIFAFVLNQEGHLLPYGSEGAATALGLGTGNTWEGTTTSYGCSSGTYNGLGCTARLIEHNYNVDY